MPLKRRPVLSLESSPDAEYREGETGSRQVIHVIMQPSQMQGVLGIKPGRRRPDRTSGLMALQLDFVAKPNSGRWMNELAEAVESARLDREGLEASVMLVSDREARLVTLLTFWKCESFQATREYCIAWMQKVLAPFADGSIRAHSSHPHFLVTDENGVAPARRVDGAESRYRQAAAS